MTLMRAVCARHSRAPITREVALAGTPQHASGASDRADIERWPGEENQALDAKLLEPLASARVRAEPALVEPREDRDDEPGGIAPARRVLVARAAHEVGELRMHRLRVEAVAVAAGDAGHPRAAAAHDDRRRRRRPP